MMKVRLFMLAIGLLWCGGALAQDKSAIKNKVIEHFESKGEPGIQVVLRLSIENKIPLGLILADRSLCDSLIDFTADNATVSKAMEALTSHLPGYERTVEDETVVLQPRAVPLNTSTLLDMTIPRFAAPLGPLKEQRLYLWMDVRAILLPNEGTVLNFLSSDAEVKSPLYSSLICASKRSSTDW